VATAVQALVRAIAAAAVPGTNSVTALVSAFSSSTLLAFNTLHSVRPLPSLLHLSLVYYQESNHLHLLLSLPTPSAFTLGAMYAGRAASRAAPAVFRAGIRTTTRAHRPILRTSPAIRILIPLRSLQTDTTSSSTQNYPPPGFDPKQASKPLPRQESKQDQQTQQKSTPLLATEDTIVPKSGATAHPKTPAQDVQTMTELAADKAAAETKEEKKIIAKKEEEKVKLTLWGKVKKELVHYWDGTKLLGFEIKISSKLALKMAAGYELTRRERRQVRKPNCIVEEIR
jgi:hypothetical protein